MSTSDENTPGTVADPYALAREAGAAIAEASGIARHDIALVLGSGWSGAADLLGETVWEAPAHEIPGFRAPAVVGHVGTLRSIAIEGTGAHALVLGARTHLYEGKGVDAVVHGVRTAAAAGCSSIVLTNGCGGIDESWAPGTPVLIRDQINFTGDTPLHGANFVDVTDLYTPRLRDLAREIDGALDEGVYMQFRGPSYETPAEVQMAKAVGATLVGMSTALEAIAAREAGLDILGISLVTNLAAGISSTPLSHAEVLEAGQAAGPRIARLLAQVVARIAQEGAK
ncbi:purine-nucleoside phosphorylase [Brachybacterium sp. JHP9]|uniref:Purine nucleoside phosphorylase n=1 Tax=Brachybacterium equifaecis TaxID=2910770 RepID=A0ABT0R2X8_9MICO|nr:purine-nucleoside phosphorylase [Brachybacterium equifaecis]MCL6424256.1 purine-nucleoside phosphorylase [Brachybacterium equifaecis]